MSGGNDGRTYSNVFKGTSIKEQSLENGQMYPEESTGMQER
jgi:hypothetical protein